MIRSFQHKGIETYFFTGSKAGIQAAHAKRLRLQLAKLDSAQTAEDMNLPGWKLHLLRGNLKHHWAVWVDQNWRLTFRLENGHATLVDYQDYH
ncbi:MAG: type II toxin-antitoxin system RelE/ParE family toxin [Betaproteobacteria bacterium]|nr:type II toxin-antitoxin system RelE/ParE family toxin [Betaproteobacteria bacterium]